MRIWGQKKYRVGAVWETRGNTAKPCQFQILGPGATPDARKCAVIYKYSWDQKYNFESEYTRNHLRKYLVCVKEGE